MPVDSPPPPPPAATPDVDAFAVPEMERPAVPPPTRFLRATAIVATLGVLVTLLGLGLLLRPVRTPLQDCGTQLGFLLDGRTNVYADPSNPPRGLTAAQVDAANARPCRERVADAAKPAGVALVVGMGSAIGAALAELGVRGLGWRKRRRARLRAQS